MLLLGGPAAADATLGLAMVAETAGDARTAIDWYRKALVLTPGNVNAIGGLNRLGAGEAGASAEPSAGSNASPSAGSNASPSAVPASASPVGNG
jgi:hypothetical protein